MLFNFGWWDEVWELYNRVMELKFLDYSVWWRKVEVISGIGYINEFVEVYDKVISLILVYDVVEWVLVYVVKVEDLVFVE